MSYRRSSGPGRPGSRTGRLRYRVGKRVSRIGPGRRRHRVRRRRRDRSECADHAVTRAWRSSPRPRLPPSRSRPRSRASPSAAGGGSAASRFDGTPARRPGSAPSRPCAVSRRAARAGSRRCSSPRDLPRALHLLTPCFQDVQSRHALLPSLVGEMIEREPWGIGSLPTVGLRGGNRFVLLPCNAASAPSKMARPSNATVVPGETVLKRRERSCANPRVRSVIPPSFAGCLRRKEPPNSAREAQATCLGCGQAGKDASDAGSRFACRPHDAASGRARESAASKLCAGAPDGEDPRQVTGSTFTHDALFYSTDAGYVEAIDRSRPAESTRAHRCSRGSGPRLDLLRPGLAGFGDRVSVRRHDSGRPEPGADHPVHRLVPGSTPRGHRFASSESRSGPVAQGPRIIEGVRHEALAQRGIRRLRRPHPLPIRRAQSRPGGPRRRPAYPPDLRLLRRTATSTEYADPSWTYAAADRPLPSPGHSRAVPLEQGLGRFRELVEARGRLVGLAPDGSLTLSSPPTRQPRTRSFTPPDAAPRASGMTITTLSAKSPTGAASTIRWSGGGSHRSIAKGVGACG